MYTCDNWVVVFINAGDPHYRVLTGTSGGYLDGDRWRMNSGIVSVEDDGDHFLIRGSSGSVYKCHKGSYCLRMNNAHIWAQFQEKYGDKIQLMNEDTDWINHDWNIK